MFFVHIAGNLGKDPETRFTPSGQKVTSFSVAVNQRKGKEDVTTWVRVVVWGDRYDKFISFLKKGSSVIIGGRMNPPTTYTDKEGRVQISLEITAEIMEFSPFGKSDRPGEGQTQSSQSEDGQFQSARPSQQQNTSSQYQNQNSHSQYQNQNAHSPYTSNASQASPASYSSNAEYTSQTSGQGNFSHSSIEEDNLPF